MSHHAPGPDVHTLVRRGHAYARRGEYLKAAEAFSGAIDIDPADADLFFHRGNSLAILPCNDATHRPGLPRCRRPCENLRFP